MPYIIQLLGAVAADGAIVALPAPAAPGAPAVGDAADNFPFRDFASFAAFKSFAHRELRLAPLVGDIGAVVLSVWNAAQQRWQPLPRGDPFPDVAVGTQLYFQLANPAGGSVGLRATKG